MHELDEAARARLAGAQERGSPQVIPAAVWLLAVGAAIVGTDAYLIAGILPAVATGLHVSVSLAGQLITVFALVYAIAAPVTATATSALRRREVLTAALAVFAAGVLMTALAPAYGWAFGGRILAAIGASCFTPLAAVSAVRLVGEDLRARALSAVVGGFTVASLLGVPLGTAVGGLIGWRAAVLGLAVLALLAAIGVAVRFPAGAASAAPPHPEHLRERLSVLRNRAVLITLLASLLTSSSEEVVYCYIGPLLGPVTSHRLQVLAILMVDAGVGGFIGNALAGRAVQRYGDRVTMLAVVSAMVAVLGVLPWWSRSLPAAAVAVFCWGLTGWAYVVPQQDRLAALAEGRPASADVGMALNSSAFYLGIGAGGLIGGVIVRYWAPAALAVPALGLGVGAMATIVFGYPPSRRAGLRA